MPEPYSRSDTGPGDGSSDAMALGLGLFSVGLGLAELTAPDQVARMAGLTPDARTRAILRSYGAREVGTGLALLMEPGRAPWLWSRVAGDALDIASLAGAMRHSGTDRRRATWALGALLGVAMLDVIAARRANSHGVASADRRVSVTEAVTINKPIQEVERRWRDQASLPESLRELAATARRQDGHVNVQFTPAPANRGTEMRLDVAFVPRGGAVGAALARLLGADPTGQIRHELRRFKQIIETGEIVLADGPALWRPGQPAEDPSEIRHAAGVGG